MLERLQNLRQQTWEKLTHPVTLAIAIASIAHGFILALPVPDKAEKAEPEPTPTETVKISSLVGAAPPPKPKPKPTPTPTPAPKTQPPEPKPTPKKRASPKAVAPSPAPAPAPSPSPAPAPSGSPEPTPSPSGAGDGGDGGDGGDPLGNVVGNDPTATGNSLIGELSKQVLAKLLQGSNDEQGMKDYMASIPTEVIKEDQVSFFVGADDALMEGAFASLAIPQTTVSDAFFDYVEPSLVNSFGFALEPQDPEYGGADLYYAENKDENLSFYFSMVKLKSGSGAFLVLWTEDPRATQG